MESQALKILDNEEVIQFPSVIPIEERNLALLKEFLKGKRFLLDCEHFSTPAHNLGNTMVILTHAVPKIICYNCYL